MTEIENFYPEPNDVITPINDYLSILDGNYLDLVKLEWWLIKYEDLYEQAYNFYFKNHLYRTDEGEIIRLPNSTKPNKFTKLIDLFDFLNQISKVHKKEEYFKYQIEVYYKICDSKTKTKQWLIENELVGNMDKFYLNLNEDSFYKPDKFGRININGNCTQKPIFVQKEKFKYAFEFFNIFFVHFYIDRLIPDSKFLIGIPKY